MAEKSFFGEGKNIEFKREIPHRHERFVKDIIAFANCSGGRVILGIEDKTNVVYGIGDVNPFKLSDSEAFHYMKIIEAWGTGLGGIRRWISGYFLS